MICLLLYLAAFMVPTCIMLVILEQGDFYPFGDKTLFIMDMRDQYLEFFAYLRYLSGGDNSLFFCWSRSMGGNFLGLFAYYLASPLSFITCLFPVEKMDTAIFLLTLLKVGLCGVSFAVYARYLWKKWRGTDSGQFLPVMMFSACYALISYNMVYSSCLMWLDGVILLPAVLLGAEKLLDGKKGLHYVLSLTALFVCNYYTGYMAGIFTGLYFGYRLLCDWREKGKRGSLLRGSRFCFGTVLAVGFSAPLLLPALHDLMQGKLSSGSGYQFSLEPNFLLSEFVGKFWNGVYDSITNSGLPAVYCGMVVLVFAAVFFACREISGREKAGAAFLLGLFVCSFYFKGLDLAWHGFQKPVWFPYRYAFLFSFFMIYMALHAICALDKSVAKGKVKCAIYAVIFLLTIADLKSNGQALIAGLEGEFGYAKTDDYKKVVENTMPLAEQIRRQDDGLYRVNAAYEYSKNDAMLFGFHGMTHYSSTYNTAVNQLTRMLGIAQAHIWNSGYGSTPLLDSLFAVSYKLSDRYEPDCYEKIADEGQGAAGYYNPLALPVVYAASGTDLEPDIQWQESPYRNQNTFLNAIAATTESYFTEMEYDYEETERGWDYTFIAETKDPVYLYMGAESGGWANIYVDNIWFGNYFSNETICSLYIGSYEPEQKVTVRVEPYSGNVRASYAVIARLNMEALSRTLEELRAGGMEITSHGGGTLKGSIFVGEGQTILTSIPYDEGWTVRVDGRKADTEKFAGTFLAIAVPAGEHELRFSYVSPGFYTGMGVFGIATVVAIFYFMRKGKRVDAILRKIVESKLICKVVSVVKLRKDRADASKAYGAEADRHIDVLDGVRAFAVVFVAWFHFWQQSWLTPSVGFHGGLSIYFGLYGFGVERFVRHGYQFVDLLILLSAFCNFYPYARAILLQEPWPDTKAFYLKRAVRILPSYYLSLIVMMVVMFAEGTAVNGFFWNDLIAHVFCVAPFFPDTYLSTNFSAVLWTVQIEVLYYILLPWVAKLFRRWPGLTCMGLWGCGIVSANYIVNHRADAIRVTGNQMFTFAGCYANGMLLCMLYIILKKKHAENRYTRFVATALALFAIWHLHRMMGLLGVENGQVVQLQQRFELSLVFSCFLIGLFFAVGWFQRLFANRIVRFIASISYNLYIWHQYLAVKCKVYRLPYWEGDTPPNMLGDRAWMWKYQILIIVVSVVVAVALTYGVEKPVAALFTKHFQKRGSSVQ